MQEELGLGRKAVVDDVVQHGDVEPAGSQVGDQQHWALALAELGDVDLASSLVQRAVDVSAADALRCQQLKSGKERSDLTWACALSQGTGLHRALRPQSAHSDPQNPTVLSPA